MRKLVLFLSVCYVLSVPCQIPIDKSSYQAQELIRVLEVVLKHSNRDHSQLKSILAMIKDHRSKDVQKLLKNLQKEIDQAQSFEEFLLEINRLCNSNTETCIQRCLRLQKNGSKKATQSFVQETISKLKTRKQLLIEQFVIDLKFFWSSNKIVISSNKNLFEQIHKKLDTLLENNESNLDGQIASLQLNRRFQDRLIDIYRVSRDIDFLRNLRTNLSAVVNPAHRRMRIACRLAKPYMANGPSNLFIVRGKNSSQ